MEQTKIFTQHFLETLSKYQMVRVIIMQIVFILLNRRLFGTL